MPHGIRVVWTTREGPDHRAAAARLVYQATGRVLRHGPCSRCGGDHGRPSLVGGGAVSLSYADDLVVAALSDDGDIGVDAERGQASAAAGVDRIAPGMTLREWTRWEAAMKAAGTDIRNGVRPPVFAEDDGWRTVIAGRAVHGREIEAPEGFVISVARAAAAAPGRSTS